MPNSARIYFSQSMVWMLWKQHIELFLNARLDKHLYSFNEYELEKLNMAARVKIVYIQIMKNVRCVKYTLIWRYQQNMINSINVFTIVIII